MQILSPTGVMALQALNDLFEKLLQRDVPARYLLRLGQGEQELATRLDFSRVGRVNAMLARRLQLLAEVRAACMVHSTTRDVKHVHVSLCMMGGDLVHKRVA